MKQFSDVDSPTLNKMEMNNGGRFSAGKKFAIGNIIGDPFSLATIGIAICGWLIAFVSSIISDLDTDYPNFAWWTLVYMLFCIVLVFITVATDTVFTYHVAITGFMAAGLVFTTSSVNSLIYYSDAPKEAGAAGFILLSMVAIVWIFYYGSQPQASHRQTLDSFALHKEGRTPSRVQSRNMTQSYRPETTHSQQPPQMYNSSALTGFETSSPVTGYPGGRMGETKRESASAFPQPAGTQSQPAQLHGSQPAQHQNPPMSATSANPPDTGVSAPTEYPYKAKAIYSYEANPDDANEISFVKHEILKVSDVSGRWWQAKKENDETGIAPSNYLILL